MEGSLRVPYMMRWPGRIPSGVISNDIVHCTDIFTTLALLGGATLVGLRLAWAVYMYCKRGVTTDKSHFSPRIG